MSRAFVKEPDGDSVVDDTPEIPVSPHPNHMTRRGLAALENELDELTARRRRLRDSLTTTSMGDKLELATLERRQRYLVKRIDSAIVYDPAKTDANRVGFGATVRVEDEEGERRVFTIVGEDEANPTDGLIGWTSPLARQLLDKEPGDEVRWPRPKGDIMLEIIDLRYE